MVGSSWHKVFLFFLASSAIAWSGRLFHVWSALTAALIQAFAVWLVLFDAAVLRQLLEEREKTRKLLKQKKEKP